MLLYALVSVPGQPLNFKAEPESETSILLSWTPPRSDTISNYDLVYKDGEHGEEVNKLLFFMFENILQLLQDLLNYTSILLKFAQIIIINQPSLHPEFKTTKYNFSIDVSALFFLLFNRISFSDCLDKAHEVF